MKVTARLLSELLDFLHCLHDRRHGELHLVPNSENDRLTSASDRTALSVDIRAENRAAAILELGLGRRLLKDFVEYFPLENGNLHFASLFLLTFLQCSVSSVLFLNNGKTERRDHEIPPFSC